MAFVIILRLLMTDLSIIHIHFVCLMPELFDGLFIHGFLLAVSLSSARLFRHFGEEQNGKPKRARDGFLSRPLRNSNCFNGHALSQTQFSSVLKRDLFPTYITILIYANLHSNWTPIYNNLIDKLKDVIYGHIFTRKLNLNDNHFSVTFD